MKTCSTFRYDPNELVTGSLTGGALFTMVMGRLHGLVYETNMKVMGEMVKTPFTFKYSHEEDTLEVPRIFYDNTRQLIAGSYNIQNSSSFCLEDIAMVTISLDGEKAYRLSGLIRTGREFIEMSVIFVCENTNLKDYFLSSKYPEIVTDTERDIASLYKLPCELVSTEPVIYL